MRNYTILVVILSCITFDAKAQLVDYIYPHFSEPTYSNYGTIGLIQMPSARMHPGGTVGFTWTHAEPYLRGSIMGNPFDEVIFDPDGKIGMELGVYATPETFLINNEGLILYKHIGEITPKVWSENFLVHLKTL